MQALILAGGKGTRLRPLTVYTPKPIVPLVNRPFLLYQLDILRKAGIEDITLSLSYQPDKIQHLMGYGAEHGVNLRYVTEPSPMGTGGAFKFASENIRETTVVLNGDILTDIDIAKLIEFHSEEVAQIGEALAREYQFRVTGHRLIFTGICSECRAQPRPRRACPAIRRDGV